MNKPRPYQSRPAQLKGHNKSPAMKDDMQASFRALFIRVTVLM